MIVLENEDAKKLADELMKFDVKLAGINIWTSGYNYNVVLFTANNTKEIVIKSKNIFTRGVFKYKTKEDMVELVEMFLCNYT